MNTANSAFEKFQGIYGDMQCLLNIHKTLVATLRYLESLRNVKIPSCDLKLDDRMNFDYFKAQCKRVKDLVKNCNNVSEIKG